MNRDKIQPGALVEFTRLCAWCQRLIGDLGWSYGPVYKPQAGEHVTHGICEACKDDLLAALPSE